ncbi:glycosyltransferase family 39 protein [Pseudarthrobacter sp. fls2-241-R2A-168]|uniref:ArnT family glycosyltransferase n=1 Tax=Pseudarthrobacter sp. fls2-241-R2A-168 TaxID=3040304 RepID=UPI00255633D8|nr:glycosyltransferase family 39 protein [Pseudarthrobacter sp. fls2-241-R2A-168]
MKPSWAGGVSPTGPPASAARERLALLLLLLSNTVLYVYNIGINGWANYYYSAAVQSGSKDPVAFFFGSSDWGNSISVDKPPLSLWVMGLSVRLFGFNPGAVVIPQAVMGVLTTWLIYKIIRKHFGTPAALFAGFVFYTTPIVTLMSRYNNPDPLMLLLMTSSVWFVLRSIETGKGRFFVMAGALLGLAFMTKQLQGLLGLPALGLAYLLYSPQRLLSRLGTISVGLCALAVTGGLWMTVVDLVSPEHRPYVGGSKVNSFLQLTLGYNGIERIAGSEQDPTTQQIPDQFRSVDSDAGIFRLLNANYNQEASWLLFAALLALVLLAVTWRSIAKTGATRALILLSGLWLLTTFLLLCFMGNQIHTYYTAALGPAMALVLGIALAAFTRTRSSRLVRAIGAAVALTGLLTSWLIMGGTILWPDWLPTIVLGAGIASVSALAIRPPNRKVEAVAALLLGASLLFGQGMTSIHNVTVGFNGSNPLSGGLSKNPGSISHLLNSLRKNDLPWAHDIAYGRVPEIGVVDVLTEASHCKWAAASYASQTAARLQLESGRPVMPIGGFAGSDPSPTLEDFKRMVARGDICYLVQQEAFLDVQAPGAPVTAISTWVRENYAPEVLGTTTVYRLKDL